MFTVWQDKTQPDSSRVLAFNDYIWKGFLFSNPDTATLLANELIEFGKKENNPKGKAFGLKTIGILKFFKGDFQEALEYYTQSLKIFEQVNDQKEIGALFNNIGGIYKEQGDYPKALDFFTQSLKISEQQGYQKGITAALLNIGNLYIYQGEYLKALEYLTQTLKINEQLEYNQNSQLNLLNSIGLVYKHLGNNSKALEFFTQSLNISQETTHHEGIVNALNNIGSIYQEVGDYPNALEYFTKSLTISKQMGNQNGIAHLLGNIGITYYSQGVYPKAMDYFTQSLTISKQLGNQKGIADMLHKIGIIYMYQGAYAKALEHFNSGIKISTEIGDQDAISQILCNTGLTYKKQGAFLNAIKNCQKSYQLSISIGSLFSQKLACKCLYDTYKAMDKGSKALEYLEKLNVITDSLNAEETSKKLQQMEFAKQVYADSLKQEEEKQLVQEAHKEEVAKKNKTRNIAIGSGLIILLIAGGLYSRNRFIKKSKDIIEGERDRSDNLLLNILPAEIAVELKEKGEATARDFDLVSILFTDFKEFTQTSEKLGAVALVAEINECFKAFDAICEKYKIEKIKTIGDAYMAAGGLPVPTNDSVKNTVLAALEMQAFIVERHMLKAESGEPAFEMRVGIHTGPVVAGIVGVKKFQYDIWGDTVNTASRMESAGEVGKVNVSQATHDLLQNEPQFKFESRGKIEAKGKGAVEMWFVSIKN